MAEPQFGIVFDIDGVLIKDGQPIPGAKQALHSLHAPRSSNTDPASSHVEVGAARVPYAFVTNGGGVPEAVKAAKLSHIFNIPIDPQYLIQSSTPMKALASKYNQRGRMLVVAKDDARAMTLANLYGFHDAVPIQQFSADHPFLYPAKHNPFFNPRLQAQHADSSPAPTPSAPRASSAGACISAVLLFEEPEDWGESLQIIVDVLRTTDGVLLPKRLPNFATQGSQPIDLFIANPDLVYSGEFTVPRFTMGGLLVCLRSLYKEVAGQDLRYTLYGKPFASTYQYLDTILQRASTNGANSVTHRDNTPLRTIYAIGDNPLSDIKGANMAGDRYFSILVRTGCFQGGENDDANPAKHVCDDVAQAVDFILRREGVVG